MIPGIPTSYNGTRFRSRLEARWAAMFDLLAWSWEYEPLDLAGYIPDFILKFAEAPSMLVEVKPIGDRDADSTTIDWAKFANATDQPIFVLGTMLHETSIGIEIGWWFPNRPVLGGPGYHERLGVSWFRDHWAPTLHNDPIRCRAGKCYPIDAHTHRGLHFDHRTRLIGLWREAGNRVQWRSR